MRACHRLQLEHFFRSAHRHPQQLESTGECIQSPISSPEDTTSYQSVCCTFETGDVYDLLPAKTYHKEAKMTTPPNMATAQFLQRSAKVTKAVLGESLHCRSIWVILEWPQKEEEHGCH